jgi:hypothetical protein
MTNAIKVLLQKTTCHLQQHFFHIFEPNKGTKGPENHSLGWIFSISTVSK